MRKRLDPASTYLLRSDAGKSLGHRPQRRPLMSPTNYQDVLQAGSGSFLTVIHAVPSQSQSTRAPCQTPCQTLQVLMLLCFFGKITIRKDHSSLTSKPPWFNADIGLFKQNVPFSEIKNCNLVWQMTENWALRIKSFVVDPENISSAILYLNLITQSNVRLQILVSSLISPRLHL